MYMKLNTGEWKYFYLMASNLHLGLLKIQSCKCGSSGDLDTTEQDINYIGAKKNDNGVMAKVSSIKNKDFISKGNGILLICDGEGSVGYSNYMDRDFIGSTTTSIGYNSNLNMFSSLFIVTILDKEKFKFSYGRKYRAHLNDIKIKLPICYQPDGSPLIDLDYKYSEEGYVPDFEFMENYIKSLHHKPLTTTVKKSVAPKLNVSEWKYFYLMGAVLHPGLLKIQSCKCGSAGDLDTAEQDINYIGAKKNENGVMAKVSSIKNLDFISKGNGILLICDGEGSVGYSNYMDRDFIGSTTTSIGYNSNLNKFSSLFIVTILDKEKFKFSYGRKYRAHLNDIKIKLPICYQPNGSPLIDLDHKYSEEGYIPDFKFMENYIKSLPYSDRI